MARGEWDGRAICCPVGLQQGYSCMKCNRWYGINDPEFAYYKQFHDRHWLVKEGLARAGGPMCLLWADTNVFRDAYNLGGMDTYGWFAHCLDKERCAKTSANNHADVHQDQIAMEVVA